MTTIVSYEGSALATDVTALPLQPLSLHGRLRANRRRRLVLRMRDWLGITVIACFAVTLFTVTLFSLLGR